MGFLDLLRNSKNSIAETSVSKKTDSSLPPINLPNTLPKKLEDFKEWHIKVLRRLDKHPTQERFSGIITKEVDIPTFIPILEHLGFITTTTYTEALPLLTLDNLKQILRDNNQKVSGKKQDLIERITTSLNESAIRESSGYNDFYILTNAGRDAINTCYIRFEEERLSFFKNAILLILDSDFNAAFRMICKANAEKPVSPGLGTNWSQCYRRGLDSKTMQRYSRYLSNSPDTLLAAIALYSEMSGAAYHDLTLHTSKVFHDSSYTSDDIRTESAQVSVQRDLEDLISCGEEKYTYLASLDEETCPVCGLLDGKTFFIKDAVIGKNCPPMHRACRCTIVSYTPPKELAKSTRYARNPKTGKSEKVPGNMTYTEWKKRL